MGLVSIFIRLVPMKQILFWTIQNGAINPKVWVGMCDLVGQGGLGPEAGWWGLGNPSVGSETLNGGSQSYRHSMQGHA